MDSTLGSLVVEIWNFQETLMEALYTLEERFYNKPEDYYLKPENHHKTFSLINELQRQISSEYISLSDQVIKTFLSNFFLEPVYINEVLIQAGLKNVYDRYYGFLEEWKNVVFPFRPYNPVEIAEIYNEITKTRPSHLELIDLDHNISLELKRQEARNTRKEQPQESTTTTDTPEEKKQTLKKKKSRPSKAEQRNRVNILRGIIVKYIQKNCEHPAINDLSKATDLSESQIRYIIKTNPDLQKLIDFAARPEPGRSIQKRDAL